MKYASKFTAEQTDENLFPSVIPETQWTLNSGRSKIDMVFSSRQLQEKFIKQQVPLYHVFIDLTMAFNMVNRERPYWKFLANWDAQKLFLICIETWRLVSPVMLNFRKKLLTMEWRWLIFQHLVFLLYFAVPRVYDFQVCDKVYLGFGTKGKVFDLIRIPFLCWRYEI